MTARRGPAVPTLDHPTLARVRAHFLQKRFRATEFRGQSALIVEPADLHEVLAFLRDDEESRYDFLSDITAVDYLGYPALMPARFAVVYVLLSTIRRVERSASLAA